MTRLEHLIRAASDWPLFLLLAGAVLLIGSNDMDDPS